jgi:diacylglycerol kinase
MIDMLLGPIYREDVRHAKDMLSGAVLISLFCGYTAALILIFG